MLNRGAVQCRPHNTAHNMTKKSPMELWEEGLLRVSKSHYPQVYKPFDHRVMEVLWHAFYRGANIELIVSAHDHKGNLGITWKKPWIGLPRRQYDDTTINYESMMTAMIIAEAWEIVGVECRENISHYNAYKD